MHEASERPSPDALDGLPLAAPTREEWVLACARAPDLVLQDHAHCELKAASTALRLVGRYSDHTELVLALTDLAREEMRHFERVHALVLARKSPLPPVGPDLYVKELRKRTMRGIAGVPTLVDQLVASAFVEARSCERFRLLSRGPFDEALRSLWGELGQAEARQHELFLDLARREVDEAVVRARVRDVAAVEAEIVRSLPVEPRIHG